MRGIILAGGKSRRFGENKALADYEGKTLLEHAIHLLKNLDLTPIVVGPPQVLSVPEGVRVIPDVHSEQGPLGGLYTAMASFPESALLVLTCDMPAISEPLLRNLVLEHSLEDHLTLYRGMQRPFYPFPGIYDSVLVTDIRSRIQQGRLSAKELIDQTHKKRFLTIEEEDLLFNVNTQEDLKRLSEPTLKAV